MTMQSQVGPPPSSLPLHKGCDLQLKAPAARNDLPTLLITIIKTLKFIEKRQQDVEVKVWLLKPD